MRVALLGLMLFYYILVPVDCLFPVGFFLDNYGFNHRVCHYQPIDIPGRYGLVRVWLILVDNNPTRIEFGTTYLLQRGGGDAKLGIDI